MVIRQIRKEAASKLSNAGVTDVAPLEVLVLMKHIWQTDEIGLLMMADQEAEPSCVAAFEELLIRRMQGEPIAHLCGKKEFMSLELEVNRNCLVPRPDTECVVERAAMLCRSMKEPKILDIGTGSGCIAIFLAKQLPEAEVTAIDCSEEALKIAKNNAKKHDVSVSMRQLDILKDDPEGRFDLIISNPPYIRSDVIPTLEREVWAFEPRMALDGGEDGLLFYRRLIPLALEHLEPGGLLVLEIGWDQSREIADLIQSQEGFSEPSVIHDLAGRSRGVYAAKLQE